MKDSIYFTKVAVMLQENIAAFMATTFFFLLRLVSVVWPAVDGK
jgi:hypothetical protein